MSFSSDVKEELAKQFSKSRHCQLAELAAILEFAGSVRENPLRLTLDTDNALLVQKYEALMRQAFSLDVRMPLNETDTRRVLSAVKWDGETPFRRRTNGLLLRMTCCRRAFLRGAFLAAGSVSDPNKSYHLELVCTNPEQAEQLRELLLEFETDAKIVERKGHFVVYLKEGSQIVDLLGGMEAYVSLMKLENVRILKEMRNSVNRRVNCETANISKTVNAAVKQIEDITRIRDTMGFDGLPAHLREIAALRLEYPDAPLKELGSYLDPPVGKSGVNHRLRRLSEIAEACEKKG